MTASGDVLRSSPFGLTGKVPLVTGGNGGTGLGMAKRLFVLAGSRSPSANGPAFAPSPNLASHASAYHAGDTPGCRQRPDDNLNNASGPGGRDD